MSKKFFISHSSVDKPLALELKDALEGDAWVDLHEIEVGDLLLQEISAGIEAATDFVLLWSKASSRSPWVEFEFNMAFIRWMEDKAIALRIVCLDDTEVPLHFRPFLQARNATGAAEIAETLQGVKTAIRRRSFFNRTHEFGEIEEALYDPAVGMLWLTGLPGTGKRSVAREALGRLAIGTGGMRSIQVTGGTAEPELSLLVSAALNTSPPSEVDDLESVVSKTAELIASYASTGGIWLVQDAENWLEDDGSFGRVLAQMLSAAMRDADDYSNRLVVLTSRRNPRLTGAWDTKSKVLRLNGLSHRYAVPMLRALGATGDDNDLRAVAEALGGHPLALEIVAPQLPLSEQQLGEHRYRISTDMIDPRLITPTSWQMLEVLGMVDGPFSGEDLAKALGLDADSFQSAVAEVTAHGLVEYSDLGYLTLHPLLRDYFLRSYRKDAENKGKTSALADIARKRLDRTPKDHPSYVPQLIAAFKLLGLSGRFDEARGLRGGLIGTLFSTATELYQEKRYAEALVFVDEALTGNEEIDRDALLLKAKTLAYLGEAQEARAISDRILDREPTSPKVLRDRGRIEFIDKKWSAAIGFYEQAIRHRHHNAQLWSDIAQAKIRMRDWEGAAAAAKSAIDRGGDTPYTLSIYSQALENQDRLEEAEVIMARAVKREPGNPAYRHRLGRIAQRRGKRDLALAEFSQAVAIDPNYFESLISLASLYADLRDLDRSREMLDRAEVIPGAPRSVLENVRAKLSLIGGDLSSAQVAIDRALSVSRDATNVLLAIRILIARGEAGELTVGQAQAMVKLLGRELDELGRLADASDLWASHPQYF